MDKRKRNPSLRDHPVLVFQVVVVKKVTLRVNTAIKKTAKLNQSIWVKNINQIVWNVNEDHVLEIEVDHIQGQNVVGRVLDIGVIHVQDIMIDDLHLVIDQDAVGRQYHVMEVLKNIKASAIVLLVPTNQKVLNTGTDDNIFIKY